MREKLAKTAQQDPFRLWKGQPNALNARPLPALRRVVSGAILVRLEVTLLVPETRRNANLVLKGFILLTNLQRRANAVLQARRLLEQVQRNANPSKVLLKHT